MEPARPTPNAPLASEIGVIPGGVAQKEEEVATVVVVHKVEEAAKEAFENPEWRKEHIGVLNSTKYRDSSLVGKWYDLLIIPIIYRWLSKSYGEEALRGEKGQKRYDNVDTNEKIQRLSKAITATGSHFVRERYHLMRAREYLLSGDADKAGEDLAKINESSIARSADFLYLQGITLRFRKDFNNDSQQTNDISKIFKRSIERAEREGNRDEVIGVYTIPDKDKSDADRILMLGREEHAQILSLRLKEGHMKLSDLKQNELESLVFGLPNHPDHKSHIEELEKRYGGYYVDRKLLISSSSATDYHIKKCQKSYQEQEDYPGKYADDMRWIPFYVTDGSILAADTAREVDFIHMVKECEESYQAAVKCAKSSDDYRLLGKHIFEIGKRNYSNKYQLDNLRNYGAFSYTKCIEESWVFYQNAIQMAKSDGEKLRLLKEYMTLTDGHIKKGVTEAVEPREQFIELVKKIYWEELQNKSSPNDKLNNLAEHGDFPLVSLYLGYCYKNGWGLGGKKDLLKAEQHFRLAEEYPEAQLELYKITTIKEPERRKYLEAAAAGKNPEAAYLLAEILVKEQGVGSGKEGEAGIKEVTEDILRHYNTAAKGQGSFVNEAAQKLKAYGEKLKSDVEGSKESLPLKYVTLGLAYEKGWGIPIDKEKAFTNYLKAANLNNPRAQYYVALSYLEGMGTLKNPELARVYLEKAIAGGNNDANRDKAKNWAKWGYSA